MDQIIHHLKKSEKILIATHTSPDGDAIGALLAMGLALGALNKKSTLYNESPIPAVYRFLPFVDRITTETGNPKKYDTAIILDCGDLRRIGTATSAVRQIPTVINIDHHITNTGFGDLQLVDTSASATSEIVYRLVKKMDIPIDTAMATSIYTGILTDTGSFRFSNTSPTAFAISEEMTQRGVDPYKVARHVYGTYSLARIKLLNLALDSIEISFNGKLSMMTITQEMLQETGTQPEDVDGLINYARRIEDVKVAALIQEQPNGNSRDLHQYHVSLRSDGSVDVAEIASGFGGGGHTSAAGFGMESTLADVKATVARMAEEL